MLIFNKNEMKGSGEWSSYTQSRAFKSLLQTFLIFIFMIFQVQSNDMIVCFGNSSQLDISYSRTKVFDIPVGSTVHLWCRDCNSMGNFYSRLWYHKPRSKFGWQQTLKEVDANYFNDKMSVSLTHTLSIKYYNRNDSGLYICKSYKSKTIFISYVLDAVINTIITPKVGTIHKWQEYKRTFIDPINKKLQLSETEPYKTFRNNYNVSLNIYTVWDNWSNCKEIEGHQKGVRKRLGRCRVNFTKQIKAVQEGAVKKTVSSDNILMLYLTDGYDVPCRSIKLNESIPEMSRIFRKIPEFEAEEICPIIIKSVKRKKIKIKKEIYQVLEGSPVILTCIEGMHNIDSMWYKDKKILKYLYANYFEMKDGEPHLSTDSNNSLHILHVSRNEEGNYTCAINGQTVKQCEVIVISRSKLLNQEFIRYSIYLAFVLSLTMTCYCAGVCVAWHRRASFADPLKCYKIKQKNHSNFEEEILLGEPCD